MGNKLFGLYGIVFLAMIILAMVLFNVYGGDKDSLFAVRSQAQKSEKSSIQTPSFSSSETRQSTSSIGGTKRNESISPELSRVMAEVSARLSEYQTDEALNELNALLESFDELSDAEKAEVLKGFAAYFTRLSQFEDAMYFYEASLQLPNLDPSDRLSVLQLLARFALNEENWDAFLSYNDQYFAEGGEYNWYVTSQLVSAYQRLGDAEAAGAALLLHLQNGIDPQFDDSNERYQRLYGETQYLPLMMSDPNSALELAQSLVQQFDRAENWKVLADLYQQQLDDLNFDRVMNDAQERGFVDGVGNWRLSVEETRTN